MTIKSIPFIEDGVTYKICTECGAKHDISHYTIKDAAKRTGTRVIGKCRACVSAYRKRWLDTGDNRERLKKINKEWSSKNKTYWYGRILKSKYGMTEQDYADMLEKQGGVCKICGCKNIVDGVERRLVVDHNHKTNAVRGLLCSTCNQGIGLLKDSFEVLMSAADYLKETNRG